MNQPLREASGPLDQSVDGWLAVTVVRAQAGDLDAFTQLFEAFSEQIWRYLIYFTKNVEDAQDIAQEVFWAAWEHLAELREPGKFRSWLYRIATNRGYDLRRRKHCPVVSFDETFQHPTDSWNHELNQARPGQEDPMI